MADYNKIVDHPECQKIIDKLSMGDPPKDVSAYLKNKYSKPEENHLRLTTNLLSAFVKNYCNTSEFVNKLVKSDSSSALDKRISESLLNNKTWKNRLAELADDKIDVERKLAEQLAMMEQRQEQIFDKIQENPGSTKLDYVMTKYFELNMTLIEKVEKIINKAPDKRIEHIHSVNMVEQHTQILQEAIHRVIAKMDPDAASTFMDMVQEELNSLKPPVEATVSVAAAAKSIGKIEERALALDETLESVQENDE